MKAIILDMYGVIVRQTGDDFAPYVQKTFPNLTTEEIHAPWFRADVGELTSLEVWAALGYRGDLEAVERAYLDTIELNPGFYEFAEAARKRVRLAILSNDSSRWSAYLREKFGLNQYFDAVSISGDLKMQKPDARIYTLAAERLGCRAEDCVYVDDREGNLTAAAALGMRPVLFGGRNGVYEGETADGFARLADLLLR